MFADSSHKKTSHLYWLLTVKNILHILLSAPHTDLSQVAGRGGRTRNRPEMKAVAVAKQLRLWSAGGRLSGSDRRRLISFHPNKHGNCAEDSARNVIMMLF